MSRIRPVRMSRREATLCYREAAATLLAGADGVEHELRRGRFGVVAGSTAAAEIVEAMRNAAQSYLVLSRLRGRGGAL